MYGDIEWWRKYQEEEKPSVPVEPLKQEKAPKQDTGLSKVLQMVGGYYGGALGKGVAAMAGEALDTRPADNNQSKFGAMIDKGVEGVKQGAIGGIIGAAGNSLVGDAMKGSASSRLGDVYKAPESFTGIDTYGISAPSGTMDRVADSPSLIDTAKDLGSNYLRSASRGLIGGDYSPIESSAVKYPDEGGFGNDFFSGMDKGGGYDKTIGYIRGGNYGGALGQQVGGALDKAIARQQAYSSDSYKKRNRYAAQ